MTYTIRDLWNDILNVDLIVIGEVIIAMVVAFIIISIYTWWAKKVREDKPITSTLWFLMPLAILFGGLTIAMLNN